ncbi:ErpL protein [Borreliella bavariensis]|uniref:ErpL protein n=1 Tax=Borreliella bavariensis TaxID=664662 RepID=UPI001C006514|nr:ErpL protein [Borreliella bavariensis]
MNKKIKMFIIFIVFALISSCKNDVNGKALETSEQSLEIPKQIEQEIKKEFNGLLNILETKDLSQLDEKDTKEIEKTIKELKDQIEKTDSKKTSLTTYSEYEKKVQEIREKLKDKFKNKKELEDALKGLEDSLKNKKEDRKKALQEAKQKFEEFKKQVDSTTGETQGAQAKGKGTVGAQAWQKAKEFGLSVNSSGGADTSGMSNEIITNALKQIEEELKIIGEGTQSSEKKK